MLIPERLEHDIRFAIQPFEYSQLKRLTDAHGNYVIKFVQSKWAQHYVTPQPLKISETPALTWGTGTYVTPLAFPLSSALYGRIGVVTSYDPTGWKIFDATDPYLRMLYVKWVEAQPAFEELVTTVHSTIANHHFRDKFRADFDIDCVLFHPDQEAEYHTDMVQHVWMTVTDWKAPGLIDSTMSGRLSQGKFTVLIDEDFLLKEQKWDLPVKKSLRQIEAATQIVHAANQTHPININSARVHTSLSTEIISRYTNGGYLHVYIEP